MKEKLNNSFNYPMEISFIKFQPATNKIIKKLSVHEITKKDLYDSTLKTPLPDGPISQYLGLSRKDSQCLTCKKGIEDCTGHFGHYNLKAPIFHIGYFKEIYKILKIICKTCASLLEKENSICKECKALNGKIKKLNNQRIIYQLSNYIELLTPERVKSLFTLIKPSLKKKLKMTDPVNLIIDSICVPPNNIRPSVFVSEEQRNEDDLTIRIAELIYTSENISFTKNLAIFLEEKDNLQIAHNSIITSDKNKGILQRLKGKTGRFRNNLSGKRVDFTGRTVISPDPNLSVEEVGIPQRIAKILTIQERVTQFNIEDMQKIIKLKKANYVIKNEKTLSIRFTPNLTLKIGDIIERHLKNGDIVLFNRQPSLHRLSIMAHKVRIHKNKTFRFNECVCTPYNADFDGDEMNIHVLQSEFARIEAKILMGVRNNFFSPRNDEPIIGAVQDFLTGGYILTSKDTFLTREQFGELISHFKRKKPCKIEPTLLRPNKLYTGKSVINFLFSQLNENINLEGKTRNFIKEFHSNDGFLVINNSKLLFGRIDKNIIGIESKTNGIFNLLSNESIKELLDYFAYITSRYLMNKGFSIGIDDVEGNESLIEEKTNELINCYENIIKLINKNNKTNDTLEIYDNCDSFMNTEEINKTNIRNTTIKNNINKLKNINEYFDSYLFTNNDLKEKESEISSLLSKVRENCGNLCTKYLSFLNAPLIMQDCGSKGSKINVSQMVSCVGQQIISGSRIPFGFTNRTLPHYHNNLHPKCRGFVSSSFRSGLSEDEFFFHAVSGREGLVDTAVKTAETGYMQRRLMKALEDVNLQYDKTVRSDRMIQFEYKEKFSDFFRVYLQVKNESLNEYKEGTFFNSIKYKFNTLNNESLNDKLTEECELKWNEFIGNEKSDLFKRIANDNLKNEFINRVHSKMKSMEYLSAVGALAGQSIGEPGTQMTLKTFHFAGVASMNITLGVPRIKEIINAVRNINTPIIKANLLFPTLDEAKKVKGRIDKFKLKDIIKSITEIYSNTEMILEVLLCKESISNLKIEFNIEELRNKIKKDFHCSINDHKITLVSKKEKDKYFIMKELKREIKEITISKIKEVKKVVIAQENNLYKLFIEGNGLREVLCTEGIEYKSTLSNNIVEINEVLGIEACRNAIKRELYYTFDSHGIKINDKHLELLSDVMTNKGLLGITRFGISKLKSSTLMLASFEQTGDNLFNSAIKEQKDKLLGVSESVIVGKRIGFGTGGIKLFLDSKN
ncbi:hypothetical protein H312_00818 [Anncaliia algerae PRA339]|uniref:DNA-directed RNA polymerase subunit n=1 Tax=Anncaliia algerae PRA339 TaxID=1288291 RepID=A0A059F3B5_9MICR|nr:hypothetical protein H312_00818 [Anncaliia algerae PRA339]